MQSQLSEQVSAALDVDTTGDKATFTFIGPAKIVAIKCVVTSTDAGGGTVAFDRRVTAGSDTGRGAADIGEITIPAANSQGAVLYVDLNDSDITVNAGDQIVVEVTADPGTGPAFVAGVEYIKIDETLVNQTDASAA